MFSWFSSGSSSADIDRPDGGKEENGTSVTTTSSSSSLSSSSVPPSLSVSGSASPSTAKKEMTRKVQAFLDSSSVSQSSESTPRLSPPSSVVPPSAVSQSVFGSQEHPAPGCTYTLPKDRPLIPTKTTTPTADRYRMPAEWGYHTRCYMAWPENLLTWGSRLRQAQEAFAQVASCISQFERVTMCVSSAQYINARSRLSPQVAVIEMQTSDSWMRDSGPIFVMNDKTGRVRGIDFDFNGWGDVLHDFAFDALVATKIIDVERRMRYKPEFQFVLEGGSIHVDGEGTCLTTEECLLSSTRNPHLNRSQIESTLKAYLGVEVVIWLGKGVYNDETRGHIDNLACFVRPGEVLLSWTDDQDDPQYAISVDAYARLSRARDAKGRSLKIHKIHQPTPLYRPAERNEPATTDASLGVERLAASYVNAYLANRAVIVPLFGDKEYDAKALHVYNELYGGRRQVVGLEIGREVLLGGGNIHCITQQVPGRMPVTPSFAETLGAFVSGLSRPPPQLY